ncbi:5-formyltetrahydrofolate cyclo-ligase [Geothrix sp. 21YS21S-4]|uniref:5-formyltetrahydrofolate cyclo-ligase n=1 Tax=Geothrix sp. 21YS21S-4 TaxID=3068889 RepID=UPI0027BA2D3D|nr:5-formyltetrahydrofolate cyclo-ligase [Geothrix sp. 21YS21S-4]
MDTKAELRAHLKARRDALPGDAREAWSKAIALRVAELCRQRGILRIGAFRTFGSELDLGPARTAHPEGLWFFPKVASTRPPRLAWGMEPLEKGHWGLWEPILAPHALPPVQLLLVPGLGFSDSGHRLGYGRGFYDALLAELPEDVLTVGVGFDAQMGQAVPVEPHDRPVKALLSERGWREI